MKVCHVVYECTPGAFRGGVQKMVFELAFAQAQQGDEVEIWTLGDRQCLQIAGGLRIRYFPGSLKLGSRELGAALRAEYSTLDVLHSHNTFLPLNVQAASVALFGTRLFYHAHGALDPRLLGGWSLKSLKKRTYIRWVERKNYDKATAVFGLTKKECEQIAKIGTVAPIFEVSNGIRSLPRPATSAIAGFRLKNSIRPEQPVILFVGRITKKKGIHLLLEAFAKVLQKRSDPLLVLCGGREQDREYVRYLDSRIHNLGIGNSIRWAGFVDEHEKAAALAASTAFLHPSYSEGMALSILEAMDSGIPTVVTPGCFMDEAVRQSALLLSSQRPEEIAATIERLLCEPRFAREIGGIGRHYVRKFHSWAYLAARLGKIYKGDVTDRIEAHT